MASFRYMASVGSEQNQPPSGEVERRAQPAHIAGLRIMAMLAGLVPVGPLCLRPAPAARAAEARASKAADAAASKDAADHRWERVEIELRDVRWQYLPEQIACVTVSPDGRIWSLLDDPYDSPARTPTAMRQLVEEQFSKPSPQLHGACGLHFEAEALTGPGSDKLRRVWVVCADMSRDGNTLLGYDGKDWTEHRVAVAGGQDPMTGGLPRFVQLADAVVFVGALQAHVLRDGEWTCQELRAADQPPDPKRRTSFKTIHVWVDAGNKDLTLVAIGDPVDKLRAIWRLRGGNWSEVPMPRDCRAYYGHFAMLDGVLLYAETRQSMVQKDGKFQQVVTARTLRMGRDDHLEELAEDDMLEAGPYRLKLAGQMGNDPAGRFYAECKEVWRDGQNLGEGLIIHGAGQTQFFPPERNPLPRSLTWDTQMARPAGKGALAWINGCLLTDLEKMTVVDRLPDTSMRVIATAPDGTLFARGRGKRVAAYRPGAVETRKVLTAKPIELGDDGGFCIAADGSIWVTRYDKQMQRFDGRQWESPFLNFKMQYDVNKIMKTLAMVPGRGGYVLCVAGSDPERDVLQQLVLLSPQLYLFDGGKFVTASRPLAKAVDRAQEHMCKAFAGPRRDIPWFAWNPRAIVWEGSRAWHKSVDVRGMGIVADKHGHAWINEFGVVRVAGADIAPAGQWVEVALPPDRGNPAQSFARVSDLAILGDGEHVFMKLEDRRTFFGRVDGKEIELTRGPRLWRDQGDMQQVPFTFQDHSGAVWLVIDPGRQLTIRARQPMPELTVRRMVSPDEGQDFTGVGVPVLVDAAGCVWLAPPYGSEQKRFTIWAPDGETVTMEIPSRTSQTPIFTGGHGRVFVWAVQGLQEYLADDPAKPAQYKPGLVYWLESDDGASFTRNYGRFGYSPLGYVALCQSRRLYLFPMDVRTAPAGAAAPQLRTWKDATGRYSVEAEFLSVTSGKVKLRKADGSVITVDLERLSDEDRAFVEQLK